MPVITPISANGIVPSNTPGAIFICPQNSYSSIKQVTFSNEGSQDFTITLYKQDSAGSPLKFLYTLNLDPGDTVFDKFTYEMAANTRLCAVSNRNTINFDINGTNTKPDV